MKKVRHLLLILLVLGTLISYASIWVSPASFNIAAGIAIFIPLFLVLNLIALIILLYKRSVRALIPVAALILGYPFVTASFVMKARLAQEQKSFSILSYNVKSFHSAAKTKDGEMFDYIDHLNADINCFQEFANRGRYVREMRSKGVYNLVFDKNTSRLAIASKYPILKHGLLFQDKKYNNIMFADLLVAKGDTLRVYNAHLQSMGITHTNPEYYEDLVSEYDDAKAKFLRGASIRAEQISVLLKHAETCSYPILIAGDFNDVPYSYNYFKVRRNFSNAFEEAGSGFGFTYNGDLPFLRIDNQFFNEELQVHSFQTIDSVDYSDHYAILGIYSISD